LQQLADQTGSTPTGAVRNLLLSVLRGEPASGPLFPEPAGSDDGADAGGADADWVEAVAYLYAQITEPGLGPNALSKGWDSATAARLLRHTLFEHLPLDVRRYIVNRLRAHWKTLADNNDTRALIRIYTTLGGDYYTTSGPLANEPYDPERYRRSQQRFQQFTQLLRENKLDAACQLAQGR